MRRLDLVICTNLSRWVVRVYSTNVPFLTLQTCQIETWAIGDVVQPREGVVSMEE
jgi:hypothetical protein